ncbi:OLC1v1010400C2 [Oldenlandia corymbosa var. corymbosa]|nr:OLC1v1010400C2 [Oldenlandia corymbosa var. corymbosa]
MIFLSWAPPSLEDQKACINKSGEFNYETKFRGHSADPASSLKQDKELLKCGFSVNHARTLVGSGLDTFEKGKNALQNWRHFGLDWAFVDSKTPVKMGTKFCVCVKEFLPWVMMPLQVVYVADKRGAKGAVASFSFGSGTLKGHLLAGEERFSISMDENKQVWYEIVSFSKPDHFLSVIGYPYVFLSQKLFAYQSTEAVRKYLASK